MVSEIGINGIVLAGGKGSRLERDKILKLVGNDTLLQRVIKAIHSFCPDIILVSSQGQSLPPSALPPGIRIIHDYFPGKGALGGMYTGLSASNSHYNLVVAADMPFLNRALLGYMIEHAPGFDAVVPRLGHLVEPLHAVYSQNCLSYIERLLQQGNLKISDLLPKIKVKYIDVEELKRFDPLHLSIFNVNTPQDLMLARELERINYMEL